MWETTDPDGTRVVLSFERWRHIIERHPELERRRGAILDAVRFPVSSRPGHTSDEEW